jgi:excinuclease ABC subunit A
VGTITEIHDYLRLLFARTGEPHCPDHHVPLAAKTVSQMVDAVLSLPADTRVMILSPVVVERKGEQAELLEDLRAQGFVRVRVDGKVVELDPPPALTKSRKHTVEVVVDRLRVRPDAQQRLGESFETALRLSDGRAILVEGGEGAEKGAGADPGGSAGTAANTHPQPREHAFSSRFACPVCSYSLPELEPRLFSFNNPMGACPRCDGLGVVSFFDPSKVVAFPDLSLAAGAVKGWDRRNQFYYQMLENLAAHFRFDVATSFERLPPAVQDLVLHGSGREKVRFTYPGERGQRHVREHVFEGIIPNLERRWRETDSVVVREELGTYRTTAPCPECEGTRLRREARHVLVGARSIHDIGAMPLRAAAAFFEGLSVQGARFAVAERIVREISARLGFLVDVGLEYLSLDRSADTLSGGESQRIRLASQIGSGLTGVMYVLDEPSIGLHQRDNDRLLATLKRLRDLGNSVIVVEHDRDAIEAADHVLDMGPGAGEHGGRVVAQGTPREVAEDPASLTGQYLSGRRAIAVPRLRHPPQKERWLHLRGARGNNLRRVDLDLPVGLFTCVTGVSGSGKSTLVNDTLARAVARSLHGGSEEAAPFEELDGADHFDKLVSVDQSPIGRTPRSNPATYTGLFTPIRELFAGVPLARERGYGPGRFSFNVKGGRCEACQGDGVVKVEMHFLPDVYVPCDVCHGRRYNRETLEVLYKGRNVHEVLGLTVEQARGFFEAVPTIARKLDTLMEVGLGYVTLGQSATTLSGGEAQRVKLSLELSRRDTGRTLYILDEPTTGLHFRDIELLLGVLHRLRDHGNTVVVIEHNLDVIKTADWVVDLGPEGGDGGGQVVVAGTPETVAGEPASHTGAHLRRVLGHETRVRAA